MQLFTKLCLKFVNGYIFSLNISGWCFCHQGNTEKCSAGFETEISRKFLSDRILPITLLDKSKTVLTRKCFSHDAIMVYKCLHNLVPEYLAGKFKKRSEVHNRQTRFSNDLNLPFCRLSTGQRAFAYRGAKLWNSIDSNIKNAKCPKTFKRCLLRVVSC